MENKIYKISCEYFIYADSEEKVIEFISNEDNLVESHFQIEEVSNIDEDDIYNHPKFEK